MLQRLLIIVSLFMASGLLAQEASTSALLGVYANENIPPEITMDVHPLNDSLFQGFLNNRPEAFIALLSDRLRAKIADPAAFVKQVGAQFSTDTYRTLDEYHVKNDTTGIINVVTLRDDDTSSYFMQYVAHSKDMFVSLLLVKNGPLELLLTCIYGLHPTGWRLNLFHADTYSISEKPSSQLYREAVASYNRGHIVDAFINMYFARKYVRPAQGWWHYDMEEHMARFMNKVLEAMDRKYKLPMELKAVKTKPTIISIMPQKTEEGYFPYIQYVSTISLADKSALKKENAAIQAMIGQFFPGINQNKKHIYYRVFNEDAGGKVSSEGTEFIQNLR